MTDGQERQLRWQERQIRTYAIFTGRAVAVRQMLERDVIPAATAIRILLEAEQELNEALRTDTVPPLETIR